MELPANTDPPKRKRTVFITLLATGIFLLGAGLIIPLVNARQAALQSVIPALAPSKLKVAAPALSLNDLQGNPVSLEAYHGQVVLVNNWAIWCPPCQAEMPELQAFYNTHSADGFVLIGIESGESADQVSAFVNEYGLTFPIWLDPGIIALEAFKNWNLPSSYVIDRDGIMRWSFVGAIDQQMLERYVTPLLEEK